MIEFRDEFLSEEDLDLQSLTDEELDAVWTAWLYQAQITNDEDRYTYSHGVFTHEPVDEANPGNGTRKGEQSQHEHLARDLKS